LGDDKGKGMGMGKGVLKGRVERLKELTILTILSSGWFVGK